MEFNLEQLQQILFWSKVKENELGLSEEEKKLVQSIKETLEHWGMDT